MSGGREAVLDLSIKRKVREKGFDDFDDFSRMLRADSLVEDIHARLYRKIPLHLKISKQLECIN